MTAIIIIGIIFLIGVFFITPIGKRVLGITKAEINSGLDKLEDPIKMYEQSIKQLEENLSNALKGNANLKAIEIKQKKAISDLENLKETWLDKARKLDKKDLTESFTQDKKDQLLIEALNKAENAKSELIKASARYEKTKTDNDKVTNTVSELKKTINDSKSELVSLKAQADAASTRKDVNKAMSELGGSDSAKAMMEKMKAKIESDEALADAYEDLDTPTTDEEIDNILAGDSSSNNTDLLSNFRKNNNV